jgi:integrase
MNGSGLIKLPTFVLQEDNRRIRWLTQEEARTLLKELPPHLADMAAFSLLTGLRQQNVTRLEWSQVDLFRQHALIHPDQAKTKKAIPVPLNSDAMAILEKQRGKHERFVFTYQGMPIIQCNTKAWRNALKRAKIENFRWHDLRHTWASWHVQNGTSLQELQQLGGWSSFEMVLRYAHLSSDHLKDAAERISMKMKQGTIQGDAKNLFGAQNGRTAVLVDAEHHPKEPTQRCVGTNLVHPIKKGLSEPHLNP